jgi:hypothetical protein
MNTAHIHTSVDFTCSRKTETQPKGNQQLDIRFRYVYFAKTVSYALPLKTNSNAMVFRKVIAIL